MGQYYRPVILRDDHSIKTSFYSHAYGNGLKLMEHSYVDNLFMRAVEAELYECPQRLVWAGDYADPDEDSTGNIYEQADKEESELRKILTKDRGFSSVEVPTDFVAPIKPLSKSADYVVNESRLEFIEVRKGKPVSWSKDDRNPFIIHPLSLMTCEGNGRGGGDFLDQDQNGLVGRWSRDKIRVTNERPGSAYTEVEFNLTEV
jgi:hypothetical protein